MRGVYVVRVKTGCEKSIADFINSEANKFPDRIFQAFSPEEEKIKTKRLSKVVKGKTIQTVVKNETVYKGYVFVDMILDKDTYWFIRSIPGVKKFVGGGNPTPLTEEEVEELKQFMEELKSRTAPVPAVKFQKDERVRIIEGPLSDFIGVIEEVNEEKAKLKVSVHLFGRMTPVELDFTQVEKV